WSRTSSRRNTVRARARVSSTRGRGQVMPQAAACALRKPTSKRALCATSAASPTKSRNIGSTVRIEGACATAASVMPVSAATKAGIGRSGSTKVRNSPSTSPPRTFTAPISVIASAAGSVPVVSRSTTTRVASARGVPRSSKLSWRRADMVEAYDATPTARSCAASARRSAGVVEAGPGSARGLPARVDLLDDRCEVLDDHVALQLQRRREVAVLLGAVRVDDLEGTDRLGPGDGPVGAVDHRLQLRTDLLVPRGLGDGHLRQRIVRQPGAEHLLVQREDGGDERLLVADHHALADQRMGAQLVLELGRGDVLPTRGDDDLLGTARDGEVALLVEGSQITGAEPAVGHRLRGGLGIVVVPLEDHHALDQDLTVVVDRDAAAGQRRPDGARAHVPREVHTDRGRGLGEAVALEDR